MKNKFLTICIILAVILSVMSFTAILMPRNAEADDTDEPTETVETSIVVKEIVIGGTVFHYVEGWTWRTLVAFSGDDFHTQNEDFVGFRGEYLVFESDQETPIGLDEVIEPDNYVQTLFE